MTRTEAKEILALLKNLKDLTEVEKINSTFIPAFKNKSIISREGVNLHGSFRLGGTKSGRLASAGPNLQQIPSTGTQYAKHIKSCIEAPKGYVLVGADYSSLEDRISALTTKDPNKLKVYTDNYDGHCLRAYAYFQNQMPDIVEKVAKAELPGKFYKVIHNDGVIEYLHESEMNDDTSRAAIARNLI